MDMDVFDPHGLFTTAPQLGQDLESRLLSLQSKFVSNADWAT
jgi:hypothetical protein